MLKKENIFQIRKYYLIIISVTIKTMATNPPITPNCIASEILIELANPSEESEKNIFIEIKEEIDVV